MISISLCMIVKNEEPVIARCLDSIKDLVDEINIVDTGSTDNTKKIVEQYTNRIFDFKWIDDFAAARNFSFQQATKDYILWLDADDLLTVEEHENFKSLKNTLPSEIDVVSMNYYLSFDDEGNIASLIRRNRLIKRKKGFQWIGAVHEYLEVYGTIFESDIGLSHLPLSHDKHRNIEIYKKLIHDGKELSPRDTYYYANELKDHELYEEAIYHYEHFLTANLGWVEDCIQACYKLSDCYAAIKDDGNKIASVLRSFEYDIPRPEACCRLGFFFMQQSNDKAAIYWYEQALTVKIPPNSPFQNNTFTTWLPHLQLCVLYDRLQQYELAYFHNEKARIYKPNDRRILFNQNYFKGILKNNYSFEPEIQ
ncbi:MAG: glycosyltransferase family 2 protein [Solibacillus sp.]|uniref:glycosyltransferase family 2 protein n=1 Tax=Solibacillus sp. TaxID=1909654 RepID=UPI003315F998